MKQVIHFLLETVLISCFLNVIMVNKVLAQVNGTVSWEEMIEQRVTDETGEEKIWQNNLEDLEELKEHPLNLNDVTKRQLEQLSFLTDLQIEHLLYYLYTHGPMKSIYELQLVEDMDRLTIECLLPFIYVGEEKQKSVLPVWKEVLTRGKNEVLCRLDFPLALKDGYREYADSILQKNPNKQYIGAPFYHAVKYGFRYKDLIYIGLNAEKDAGEPFFKKGNKKGYDYYSFYFYLRNLGRLKTLAVGNYRLSFGQGLVMSTDYNLGKSASLATLGYKSGGIKKHSSTDEYNYFRGVAASYAWGNFLFSGFYSYRKLDAIVDNGLITSLKKDGMHRIEHDFEKKNKCSMQLIGSNITFNSLAFKAGVTMVYNVFNKVFKPETKPYSVFYPQGKCFFNVGIDYRYKWKKILFFGEMAVDKKGRVATLNIFRFAPVSGYQMIFLHRYYAKDYWSWFGRSISEGSGVQNENGFYIGLELKPVKYCKINTYADFFKFPWLRYGIDKPSAGFDGLIHVTYSPRSNFTLSGRYRYKVKEKNYKGEIGESDCVLPFSQHKFRCQLGYNLNLNLLFRTTVDSNWVHFQGKKVSRGFMLFQQVSYSFQQFPLTLDIYYGFFDTDDYFSRVILYERGVLYGFSMPSFWNKGVRGTLNLKYVINRKLTVFIKLSQTQYADRKEIGTGLEKIQGNSKTDLYTQFRWKF